MLSHLKDICPKPSREPPSLHFYLQETILKIRPKIILKPSQLPKDNKLEILVRIRFRKLLKTF